MNVHYNRARGVSAIVEAGSVRGSRTRDASNARPSTVHWKFPLQHSVRQIQWIYQLYHACKSQPRGIRDVLGSEVFSSCKSQDSSTLAHEYIGNIAIIQKGVEEEKIAMFSCWM
jgi:hypothetical protein